MDVTAPLPGHVTSEAELTLLGFAPLILRVLGPIALPEGTGAKWDTLGTVPTGPGHYLFTVEDDDAIHVTYVGLTEELWMVTKGQRPGGKPRGGQRYGRPLHAGATRKYVNLLAAEQLEIRRRLRHWVRPLPRSSTESAAVMKGRLVLEEEELILRWHLREVGWNRG